MQLWLPDLTVDAAVLASREFWVAEESAVLQAVYSISPLDNDAYELEDFWVATESMGRGVGRALLEHVVENLRAKKAAYLKIVSDPHAKAFYEKCGAQVVGETESRPSGRFLPVLELAV